MFTLLRDINAQLQEHNRRIAGQEWRGKAVAVDPVKKRVRVLLGKTPEGEDVLSPWGPYKQTAGALKLHSAPSIGQVMAGRSESGDLEQVVFEPFHWSDANPSPSDDGDAHVLTFGDVTVTLLAGEVSARVGGATWRLNSGGFSVDVGDVTWTLSADGEATIGGLVTHNGQDIGDTHVHGGVVPGGSLTDPPA
jgi:phage baseplate assembly protein gpV